MSNFYVSKKLHEKIFKDAHYRCGYCQTAEEVSGASMQIEHILPRALGGLTIESNLWLACAACNEYKSDNTTAIDPVTGETVPLFNPREQNWYEHFAWTENKDLVVGITPIGRATVVALKLNRANLVKARNLWVKAGGHPPED